VPDHDSDLSNCYFTKTPTADFLYNRSWALNEGARHAKGSTIILHDGDMLVPAAYAAEMKKQIDAGYQIVNLKRFIAFLDQRSSSVVFEKKDLVSPLRSEEIMANATAGGSIGVEKDSFFSIGAMDEEFVGWGGEDTEFWDRCETLDIVNSQYLPLIHLWHPSQPGKAADVKGSGFGLYTGALYERKMSIPRLDRITCLKQKQASSR
jgi:hypothetical protein